MMFGWIAENLGTIGISILLVILVVDIIIKMINDKKQGKSSCGGNCAHCNMCAACRQKAEQTGNKETGT